jgi:GNAT superfamily N-acetyltransferase
MTDRTVLATLAGGYSVVQAIESDVPAIVAMLVDDEIAQDREIGASDVGYHRAFAAIDDDPGQLLVLVLDPAGDTVGTLQLSFIPGLSRYGATRALVEAVRVSSAVRGTGIGTRFIQWAIDYSRDRGAAMIQLTTDQRRTDAHRFYRRLGFQGSHLGMKLPLTD